MALAEQTMSDHEDAVATTPPANANAPRRSRTAPWVRRTAIATTLLVVGSGAATATWFYSPPAMKELVSDRYVTADEMIVPVQEFSTFEYPEDPSPRSTKYGQYQGRSLRLIKRDASHFDFVFEPTDGDEHVATIAFRNVDVARMTPGVPEWCLKDDGLTRIALTDREWNRQQVQFPVPGDVVEITGGDGWEQGELEIASIAKNCLNAGLWEVLLFHFDDEGKKQMYYQGWFTFPLGHYRDLIEANTGLAYEDHWFGLEHWDDPAGTVMNMDGLRTISSERETVADFNPDERLIIGGEQVRKKRTLLAPDITCWGQLPERDDIRFATFIPPGTYSVSHPWANEYWRLAKFETATLRDATAANGDTIDELELVFTGNDGSTNRFIVGGLDFDTLPQLPIMKYPKGAYMPMGIGTPPFYQDYAALLESDPMESPYYSFLLDEKNRWIDHHKSAIDGPVMHRDENDPSKMHLYLLSYERHTLVAHFVVSLDGSATNESPTPVALAN